MKAAAEINEVASDYIAEGELLRLTRGEAGKPVPVSPLLFGLLSEALLMAEKTRGCFDPTLGPVTRLWRESRRSKKLPDPSDLEAARAACGWKNVVLDPATRTATFLKPGMRLDLGGIAKGQAADAMLAAIAGFGISRTCITIGGDVRVGDAPPGMEGWKVAIKTGGDEGGTSPLLLTNAAVSTSGDLHQFIEIEGIRYSHIIDPSTGLGLTRHVAATVVAPRGSLSDAIDTACCVAPRDGAEAMALAAGATRVILAG